ncbi:hypothetical protein SAMN05192574_102452 [Mucilaginibacter gossypiicola]|uniref:DUF4177 domain-containing protein n=1 Tax=Mucilaginibacter gossypiicola TaxID=551995 RepID=A0A1H8DS55_9SPHI|nr:hypothetical protein [Mucilaginibacter gossypiicola]SEN10005.1 hypothetical protein SAMN05192574_102452 [Mucilaginibacter gossypiicola]
MSLQEKYCIIKTIKHAFSSKVDITVDFGMEINFSKEFETVEKFTSVVDALNYMSAQGWELVNSISSGTILELHHIMKKRSTE